MFIVQYLSSKYLKMTLFFLINYEKLWNRIEPHLGLFKKFNEQKFQKPISSLF